MELDFYQRVLIMIYKNWQDGGRENIHKGYFESDIMQN